MVWSYDRRGERQDAPALVREATIEASLDGRTWRPAVRRPVPPDWRHGHAAPLGPPAECRFVRLRFFDGGGKPTAVACDEIEVY